MVDNLKSAVLQRLVGVATVFNPRYLDFSRHHGFEITACNIGRGNEKGRVESGVGYVKKNFLRGLDLTKLSAIQAAALVGLVAARCLLTPSRNQTTAIGDPRPKPDVVKPHMPFEKPAGTSKL